MKLARRTYALVLAFALPGLLLSALIYHPHA